MNIWLNILWARWKKNIFIQARSSANQNNLIRVEITEYYTGRVKIRTIYTGRASFAVVITRQSKHDCLLGGSDIDAVRNILIPGHNIQDFQVFVIFTIFTIFTRFPIVCNICNIYNITRFPITCNICNIYNVHKISNYLQYL